MDTTKAVEAAILDIVARGEVGQYLPSERELAAQMHAGRATVQVVLRRLGDRGVIGSSSRGWFVVRPLPGRHPECS